MIKAERQVVLVVPPFQMPKLPALGVSQMKANLERAGYPTRLLYLNVGYADAIGIDAYNWISSDTDTAMLGEYIFSHCLFDHSDEQFDRYLAEYDIDAMIEPIALACGGEPGERLLRRWIAQAREFCEVARERVLDANPWVVGLTSTFQQNCASLAILRQVKRARPDVVTVIGGANCESVMGEELFVRFPEIDWLGQGECDLSIVELVERLSRGEHDKRVPGFLSRHYPEMTLRAQVLTGDDMDRMPYPDFSEYVEALAGSAVGPRVNAALALESARGCWWGAKQHCTFCGLNGQTMAFRSKSPDRFVEELQAVTDQTGYRLVAMADNILDMQYFKSVLPQLAERGDVQLFYETKANLSREQVRMLAQANVSMIQPGIESLSDHTLKLMRKGCSVMQNVQLLKWCGEYGIRVGWNHLYGFPGEKEEELDDVAAVAHRIHHLTPPSNTGVLHVDRFSPHFNQADEFGIAPIKPRTSYGYVYPFEHEALERLAYTYESDFLNAKEDSPGCAKLIKIVKRWQAAHGRAFLLAMPRTRSLWFIDSRPCNWRPLHRVTGLTRSVYEACDKARTRADLVKRFAGESPEAEVDAALAKLVKRSLVLRYGEKYLALATDPAERIVTEYLPGPNIKPQAGRYPLKLRLKRLLAEKNLFAAVADRLAQRVRLTRAKLTRRWVGWAMNALHER